MASFKALAYVASLSAALGASGGQGKLTIAQFSAVEFTPLGSDAPAKAGSWDVLKGPQVVASSDNPSGWEASYEADKKRVFLAVPLVPLGDDYEVRVSTGSGGASMVFSVEHFKESPLGNPLPVWASSMAPLVGNDLSGPSGSVRVNTATGVMVHSPQAVDLDVSNPTGPSATFERIYQTDLALEGASQPGLPVGWTHNYAFKFSGTPGAWGELTCHEPNGSVEKWTPVLENDAPTGEFKGPPGDPYILTGVPKAGSVGDWESLRWSLKSGAKWDFLPDSTDPETYRLRQIANIADHFIRIHYDKDHGFRLSSVENDAGLQLLQCAYDEGGYLKAVTSTQNTQVRYAYDGEGDARELSAVSNIVDAAAPGFEMRWSYKYVPVDDQPFLSTVSMPSPTGTGISTCTLKYDPSFAKCTTVIDAEGNKQSFTYHGGWQRSGG